MTHQGTVVVRICAHPSCGLPIEEDRARHAKYCKLHGHHEAAKTRRVYSNTEIIVHAWRAANRDLVRLRTRLYVRQYRDRKKLERQLTQDALTGASK